MGLKNTTYHSIDEIDVETPLRQDFTELVNRFSLQAIRLLIVPKTLDGSGSRGSVFVGFDREGYLHSLGIINRDLYNYSHGNLMTGISRRLDGNIIVTLPTADYFPPTKKMGYLVQIVSESDPVIRTRSPMGYLLTGNDLIAQITFARNTLTYFCAGSKFE